MSHEHTPAVSVMKSGETWVICSKCGRMLEVRK